MNKRRTWDEKKILIKLFDEGKLTMPEFNKKHKLTANAIYQWRNEIKNKAERIKATKDWTKRVRVKEPINIKKPITDKNSAVIQKELCKQLEAEYKATEAKLLVIRNKIQTLLDWNK